MYETVGAILIQVTTTPDTTTLKSVFSTPGIHSFILDVTDIHLDPDN